ncbi:ATP phosphoribosyltransferase [uncultured Parasphingopyxis sp.]|uniref:ATP phosphoribosyltransferase n=1 Tax=uncultured Parasphingopyxis sp. TaxID=1547918 RepID=UPI00262EC6E6|nr:ATP phosphoribosyltransferase [uncultured Parasphingopyxis sp.]
MTQSAPDPIVFAIPKGRILDEALPLLAKAGIVPEEDFHAKDSRALRFKTNRADLDIIRVRAFDVATFVAHGAAQLGIVGSDVLEEFKYSEIYAPVDLDIGHCRLSVAEPREMAAGDDPREWSHIRIATKYPNFTRRHFEAKGVQAECVKLNGAMEIAPALGLTKRIVDLVSSGGTLKANDLVEVDVLCEVTSRLIVNRAAFKTRPEILPIVDRFREIVAGAIKAPPLQGRGWGGDPPQASGERIAPTPDAPEGEG